ncbi:MAG TPA: redoxin domain-containing protein [Bryobacteraceae bacterium]|nr:redoxin domain-containing protein [Bryobacteraceae bacterium]
MLRNTLFFVLALLAYGAETHPILPIGSTAPEFTLPGVDGKIHRLADYAASPILVIVFTCNHCPIAQMYEQRIMRLYDDYRDKGVAVVAIQPNAPEALRVDELDSSDMSDTLAEMKIRAAYKHLTYPYLYDGETQSVARAYGPQATPHVFVFDRDRRLRYEGRFDNSYRLEMVKTQDARNAIDAVLAGKPVEVTHTGVFGCSTKWKEKEAERLDAIRKLEEKPVTLEAATPDDLRKLRTNAAKKLTLVSFWDTQCASCIAQLPGIETTYRMYSVRGLELVTVATNSSAAHAVVQQVLDRQHATSHNLMLPSGDMAAAERAFDPAWDSALPFTVLITTDGRIAYRKTGYVDMLELRRTILANFDWEYAGFSQYWAR